MDLILTSDRELIRLKVLKLMQEALNLLSLRRPVTDVKMQKADPPDECAPPISTCRPRWPIRTASAAKAKPTPTPLFRRRAAMPPISAGRRSLSPASHCRSLGRGQAFPLGLSGIQESARSDAPAHVLRNHGQGSQADEQGHHRRSSQGVIPYFQLPALKTAFPAQPQEQPQAPSPARSRAVHRSGSKAMNRALAITLVSSPFRSRHIVPASSSSIRPSRR